MKFKQISSLCLAASVLAAAPAMAWESQDGSFNTSSKVSIATDRMWRGASQTDSEPSVTGEFNFAHITGLYGNLWASNLDRDFGSKMIPNPSFGGPMLTSPAEFGHIELRWSAGYSAELGETGASYDVGVMRYAFPGTDKNDWNEVYVGVGYNNFSLNVSHSEDALATGESGTHILLGYNKALPMGLQGHANYAFYLLDDDINDGTLQDFNFGVSKNLVGFDFDITYFNTLSEAEDFVNNHTRTDSRFVFTISKSID